MLSDGFAVAHGLLNVPDKVVGRSFVTVVLAALDDDLAASLALAGEEQGTAMYRLYTEEGSVVALLKEVVLGVELVRIVYVCARLVLAGVGRTIERLFLQERNEQISIVSNENHARGEKPKHGG